MGRCRSAIVSVGEAPGSTCLPTMGKELFAMKKMMGLLLMVVMIAGVLSGCASTKAEENTTKQAVEATPAETVIPHI